MPAQGVVALFPNSQTIDACSAQDFAAVRDPLSAHYERHARTPHRRYLRKQHDGWRGKH